MKKLILLVIVVAAVVGVWYWRKHRPVKPETVYFRSQPVARASVTQDVTATGTISPIKKVEVATQVTGKVITLAADYNSHVTEGHIIAVIDPKTYESQLASARAQLKSNQATLERTQAQIRLAKKELERLTKLFERGHISESDLDSAQSNYDQLVATEKVNQAAIEQSEASVKTAETNLSYCTITSPVTGVVITRAVDEGQIVVSSMNASALFTIATDLSRIQVEASIPEADIGEIKVGQTVNFTVDAYKDKFVGKVMQIRLSSTTTSNVVTYPVIVEAENPGEKLFPGMTATISIVVSQAADVLTVSAAALRFVPEGVQVPPDAGQVLWVADDANHIHPVPVEVGISDGINVQVSSEMEALEGKEVATGVMTAEELKKSKEKEETNPFMMRPPGGGRRGPGGPGGGGPGGPPPR